MAYDMLRSSEVLAFWDDRDYYIVYGENNYSRLICYVSKPNLRGAKKADCEAGRQVKIAFSV